MAIRTASKRAYLQGEGAKRQEWGISTVILNKRTNACPHCAKFAGRVFIDDVWSGGTATESQRSGYPLLSSAIEQGLYHPRCKDSHTTFFEGVTDEPEMVTADELKRLEEIEQAEAKKQYAERQGAKFERLAGFSLDGENRERYKNLSSLWHEEVDGMEKRKELYLPKEERVVMTRNEAENIANRAVKQVSQRIEEMDEEFRALYQYYATTTEIRIVPNYQGTFAYHPTDDAIWMNPYNKEFQRVNFVDALIHELGHRFDEQSFHSWENPAFTAALTQSQNKCYNYIITLQELVHKYPLNGFLHDLVDILSKGNIETFYRHENLTKAQEVKEVFANACSLLAINCDCADELFVYFPELKQLVRSAIEEVV